MEQPLPPYGACLLGSVNMAKMVDHPFEKNASLNVPLLKETVAAYRDWETDRKSTRLNSSHITRSRMPSSA